MDIFYIFLKAHKLIFFFYYILCLSIWPTFFVGPHVTPGKVYGWSNFQKISSIKIRFLKIKKIHEIFFIKSAKLFVFVNTENPHIRSHMLFTNKEIPHVFFRDGRKQILIYSQNKENIKHFLISSLYLKIVFLWILCYIVYLIIHHVFLYRPKLIFTSALSLDTFKAINSSVEVNIKHFSTF